jgi:hypothetical protein
MIWEEGGCIAVWHVCHVYTRISCPVLFSKRLLSALFLVGLCAMDLKGNWSPSSVRGCSAAVVSRFSTLWVGRVISEDQLPGVISVSVRVMAPLSLRNHNWEVLRNEINNVTQWHKMCPRKPSTNINFHFSELDDVLNVLVEFALSWKCVLTSVYMSMAFLFGLLIL